MRQRDETLLRIPGKVVVQEVRIRHKEGGWRWVENTISNLLHEPGIRAVVMNLRDITERKQADAERAPRAAAAPAEKMEAVGRLAGGIAHDFNNILGGILGYAEMLVETAEAGSSTAALRAERAHGGHPGGALVEQILSYSRSQRGKRVPVELDRIVAETLELVRGSLGHGIRLETRLPEAPLYVVGDPTQLHQIMMNLCTNAIHAMGEHGTLRVTLEPADIDATGYSSTPRFTPGGMPGSWSRTAAPAWTQRRLRASSSRSSPPRKWARHGAGPIARLRHRHRLGRGDRRHQHAGPRKPLRHLPAARRFAGGRGRRRGGAGGPGSQRTRARSRRRGSPDGGHFETLKSAWATSPLRSPTAPRRWPSSSRTLEVSTP